MTIVRITRRTRLVLDLFLDGRPHYGFDLMQATGLPSGTLYPILARLEGAGWLTSGWGDDVAGPRRRYHHLTDLGRREAGRN